MHRSVASGSRFDLRMMGDPRWVWVCFGALLNKWPVGSIIWRGTFFGETCWRNFAKTLVKYEMAFYQDEIVHTTKHDEVASLSAFGVNAVPWFHDLLPIFEDETQWLNMFHDSIGSRSRIHIMFCWGFLFWGGRTLYPSSKLNGVLAPWSHIDLPGPTLWCEEWEALTITSDIMFLLGEVVSTHRATMKIARIF